MQTVEVSRKKEEKLQECVSANSSKEVHSRKKWVKPSLEDVSGKIMAQPYIRFT
jgi:hypothetical protein